MGSSKDVSATSAMLDRIRFSQKQDLKRQGVEKCAEHQAAVRGGMTTEEEVARRGGQS